MRRGWLLAVFLTAAGAHGVHDMTSTAEAATVQALSPGKLAARSTVIFIGTVERQESRFVAESNHVVTDTVFAVERLVKGPTKTPTRLALTQLGGVVGEGDRRRGTEVPGYARFTVGERVMLFLEPTSTGRLVPTGLAQGKYVLKVDPATGETLAIRDTHDLHLVGNRAQAHLLGAPQDPNRLTLEQLLAIARGERPVDPVPLRRPIVDVPTPTTGQVSP